MRLIDADALSESIKRGAGTDLQKFFADVCVATAPTVDAAIVTRCEDCKHLVAVNVNGKGIPTCRMSGMEVAPAEFCSRGEKERRC